MNAPSHPPAAIERRLLRWFDRHGRKSLPWQRDRDPYRIWVAEIMLQQTRVATVIPYYRRFIARFPDIAALARCDLDELLHHWSGLGYYARARNLRAAARQMVELHGGRFPDRFEQVLALPGIGKSTAGAVLAFAWGQRHAVLDGNVKRVLARYRAVGGHRGTRAFETELWRLAERFTPSARAGDHAQAMMDLGATVCLAARPLCGECPLASDCAAHRSGDPCAYPRAKRQAARRRRATTMLLVRNDRAEVLLVKRPPSGIWGGLWSLPECDDDVAVKQASGKRASSNRARRAEAWFERRFGFAIEAGAPLAPVAHSFTHFDLDILPLPARCADRGGGGWIMDSDAHLWYNPSAPARVGLPAAVKRIVNQFAQVEG